MTRARKLSGVSRRVWPFVVPLALLGACGSNGSASGAGGPCTRTSDCRAGLHCGANGVCAGPDAGTAADGGGDDASNLDARTGG